MPLSAGFVGSVALSTAWGSCKLHDLARITAQRDQAQAAFAAQSVKIQQAHTEALAAFDTQAAQILSDDPEAAAQIDSERAELLASQAAQLAAWETDTATDIAGRLPTLHDGTAVQGVIAGEPASEFVDVTIASIPIDGLPDPIPVVVRCAPDCVFVTEQGDVAAAQLQGVSILRVYNGEPDTYVVPSVSIVNVAPVPTCRVQASADTCRVGADSLVMAAVRLA